jgi:prepilin-type N-terminal cleavage/methylation domain-containing protein
MLFWKNNKGFTLVELLVVISIIGILAAALTTQVTKARDVARAMRCKANLRNLAQAALNYGVDNGMPFAGSYEVVPPPQRTSSGAGRKTNLHKGWVDWTTENGEIEKWPKDYSGGGPSFSGDGKMVAKAEGRAALMSVTNGVLWGYMGKDVSTYVCDAVKAMSSKMSNKKVDIYRTYVMNGYFGYNKDNMPTIQGLAGQYRPISLNDLSSGGNAGERVLFAELALDQEEGTKNTKIDGVLETRFDVYNTGRDTRRPYYKETIGFNHLVGKRYVSHLAYADGHVDVLNVALSELKPAQLKGLTYLLCNGKDVPGDSAKWKVP